VGHDRDREATRVFRLSRIAGDVVHVGRPGEVQVPDGVDIRSQVAVLAPDQPRDEATLRVRPGTGVGLRRRATQERPGAGADGWDELVVGFGDPESLAELIAGYGPDVVAVAPENVREAVVRRLTAVLEEAS
jgi:predicted DNA-binding transcriptional regulator YafY